MNTVNKLRKVVYVAVGFTTGLTDLTLTVRHPDGTSTTPSFTEQGDGVYTASYTPDVVGTWQEKVSSATNGDKVVRSLDVLAFDDTDVKADVDAVSTKVDAVKTDVDAVSTKVDSVQTSVDTVKTDVDSVGTSVNTVSSKVDAVKSELDQVKTAVDNISTEAKPGGYFA